MLCKGHGFCEAMDNDASWEAVVDVGGGSLVRVQVGARRGTEAKLLHSVLHGPMLQIQTSGVNQYRSKLAVRE
jgi:hypothetical protein